MGQTTADKTQADQAAAKAHEDELVTKQEAPAYELQILADPEARWSRHQDWQNVTVGHTWVRLIGPAGETASWGYWPGEEVSMTTPQKSVRGEVRSPDEEFLGNSHLAHVTQRSYPIAADAAQRVAQTANAKIHSPTAYNLFDHNCVDFVRELAGQANVAPPETLFEGILDSETIAAAAATALASNERAQPVLDAEAPK